MLHQLRKLHHSLGPALLGVVVLAWLSAALLPCNMEASPATRQNTAATHDCCPAQHHHTPSQHVTVPHCTTPGCEMLATDQQQFNPLQLPSWNGLTVIVALLMLAWPRATPRGRKLIILRAPPPRPHPTLAYCTLLI